MQKSFPLPSLDASSLFNSDNQHGREVFAHDLWNGLERYGFVTIRNHGVPLAMIQELFCWSQRLFELPLETKLSACHHPGPQPQRGYSRYGEENAAKLFAALHSPGSPVLAVQAKEAREHFDLGSTKDAAYPNRWLAEDVLPGFRSFAIDFYNACHRTSMLLLEALELASGLPTGCFTRMCGSEASELRLNFYPHADVQHVSGQVSRIGAHTDLGVITCLFQDDVGGLEIEDRNAAGMDRPFRPVKTESNGGEMVVNVSETMQRWTNDRLKAGIHRVTVPDQLKECPAATVPPRISVPFFVKADRTASVGPLGHFVHAGERRRYEDMTALQYHQERVANAY